MNAGIRINRAAALLLVVALLLAGCQKQLVPAHPNQISTFDGWAYDSLVIARQSLSTASDMVKADPALAKFKPQVNIALQSYNTASAAYQVYHQAGSATADTTALQTSIAGVVAQVAKLLTGLGVKP